MFLLTVVGINLLLSVLVLGEGKDGCEEDEEKPVGETEQDSDQLISKDKSPNRWHDVWTKKRDEKERSLGTIYK